jgi:hypothetical protein
MPPIHISVLASNPESFDGILKFLRLISALNDKEASFIRDQFIPDFLYSLETCDDRNLNFSGSMNMELSREGEQRWREAIENDVEFEPFRKFEQLRPFMNEAQQQSLDSSLIARQARAEALAAEQVQAEALRAEQIAPTPIMLGNLLAGGGLFSATSAFAGNRWAKQGIGEDDLRSRDNVGDSHLSP